VRVIDQKKSLYGIQCVLGPRDIFSAYTVPTLKPNSGRLLIQRIEDYLPTQSSETEGVAIAEKVSRKRSRSSEITAETIVQDSAEPIPSAKPIPKKETEQEILMPPPPPEKSETDSSTHLPDPSTSVKPLEIINLPPLKTVQVAAPPPFIPSPTFCGSLDPFTRWGIQFEGFPNRHPTTAQDCGICGTSLLDSEIFQCSSCPLVIHQTCLQYTKLKEQILDFKTTVWSCPICSLCLFCRQHPINGIEKLERNYFSCIFCPEKEPLILMERMKSGLFSHSLCRFLVNTEETAIAMCSICGKEGSGLVRF
jgi:hypothetical protein